MGWFPLESMELWLTDRDVGPLPEHGSLSRDAEQSLTSFFSSKSPDSFPI